MKLRTGTIVLLGVLAFPGWVHSAAGRSLLAQVLRWEDLSPRQRERAWQNYQRFRRLPQDEQEELRERYRRWLLLPPKEQQQLRHLHRRYRALSPQERKELLHAPSEPEGKEK